MPWSETMFKGTQGGPVDERLQAYRRSRGFPSWLTVTMGVKGSYREQDIIAFLQKHLEPWTEGRRWHIVLADDFSAHKTDNVFQLCWQRGYVLLIHGGGCTPVGQTPDTDLNEHVRRDYGQKECTLLMEKLRHKAVGKRRREHAVRSFRQYAKAFNMTSPWGERAYGSTRELHADKPQ